jgi:transposase
MSRFIEGEDRGQATLFPERLDDYITEENAVRVIDVFIDELDISGLGLQAEPKSTGRPGFDPRTLLKRTACTGLPNRC